MSRPASFLLAALAAAFCGAALAQTPAAPDVEAGRAKAQVCAACHGADGNSVAPTFPSLAGQTWRYLYIQLRDYQEGRRNNPVMSPFAKPLSRQDAIDIANFYAAQPLKPTTFKADDTKVTLGKAKAEEMLCTMCHLGGFLGQNEIPRVAGQQYDYIMQQLHDFKARTRTNDAGSMTSVTQSLSDADIENLGNYLASMR